MRAFAGFFLICVGIVGFVTMIALLVADLSGTYAYTQHAVAAACAAAYSIGALLFINR